ncbi:NAD-dependent deacetylase sirtuin-7 [Apiospora saccharicola]|uniref:protein acetyllysine N-acetyltransferase n=1 Tax=Apiospora saccharicola TaxID=335842 RepID=A0ABR1WJU1_9PEZI
MADSAPMIAAEERQETPEVMERKANTLVNYINKSKHIIVFTGAGISTSTGIPDFRGPEGVWTLRKQGRLRTSKAASTLQAIPSPTHMALVELQDRDILKYVVSQNCDGLHRRSGILPDRISELHGNSNLEHCKDCGKQYIRDFRAVSTFEKGIHDHRTGRKCALCGGILLDTIINFGEFLSAEPLQLARDHAKKADLCIALGSSLTIPPASEIPETVGKRKAANLVICNLQETPLDKSSSLRIFGKTDDLMERVMEKLSLPIPKFMVRRLLVIRIGSEAGRYSVKIEGVDVDGTPVTFLQSVKLENNRRVVRAEPFTINLRDELEIGTRLKLVLEFMGHYGEPNLELSHLYDDAGAALALYLLEYDPLLGQWTTTRQDPDKVPAASVQEVDSTAKGKEKAIPTEESGMPDNVKPSPATNATSDHEA